MDLYEKLSTYYTIYKLSCSVNSRQYSHLRDIAYVAVLRLSAELGIQDQYL